MRQSRERAAIIIFRDILILTKMCTGKQQLGLVFLEKNDEKTSNGLLSNVSFDVS